MSTFPAAAIRGRVQIAFGADPRGDSRLWTFTDLSTRWHTARDVKVKAGRSEGATHGEPSEFEIWLNSTDGALMPEDERSEYWPYVIEGTPVRWSVDAGWGWSERFTGFIRSLSPEWPGESKHQCLVRLEAAGPSERLDKGSPPLRSPIRRHFVDRGAVTHWTLEDKSAATSAANTIPGAQPMSVFGTLNWATDTTCTGSGPQPVFQLGATARGVVPPYLDVGSWDATALIRVPEAVVSTSPILELSGTGTVRRWLLQLGYLGDLSIRGYNAAGTEVFYDFGYVDSAYGQPLGVVLRVTQVGSDLAVSLNAWAQDGSVVMTAGDVLASHTAGTVTSVTAAPGGLLDGVTLGQLAILPGALTDLSTGVLGGYVGETASDRIERLCGEEFVNLALLAGPSAAMGPQPVGSLLSILQDCEKADGGILSEYNFGFRWLPHAARYNRAAGFTLDAEAGQLAKGFKPKRDSQRARNEWEISRVKGSSATYRDEADQQRRGIRADGLSVNVHLDSQLMNIASWRTHLGMAPGMRYPRAGVNLHGHPDLILDWLAMTPGDWWQITSPPEQHPRSPIVQVLEGYTETWSGRRTWLIEMTGSPASPYVVFVLDDPVLGRLDTGVLAL